MRLIIPPFTRYLSTYIIIIFVQIYEINIFKAYTSFPLLIFFFFYTGRFYLREFQPRKKKITRNEYSA